MKCSSTISLLIFFIHLLVSLPEAARSEDNGVYIVYMGAASASTTSSSVKPIQLLESVKGKSNALVHSYTRSFSGFAARLSEDEARSIAQKPGVISVFQDPLLQLHTTRSWDFLNYQSSLVIDTSHGSFLADSSSQGADTIIGILDSGIRPESESFNDKGMAPVPSRWKGLCMEGNADMPFHCNRKLIGARVYYGEDDDINVDHTPRDIQGHGTHVASTAAGSLVANASYYGLAAGTAKSGSPGSRLAVYKVCTSLGCRGSAILAAFDDAIADGVDVLSLSLGGPSYFDLEIYKDPIALGAFHAMERGIVVVCSAGNEGPAPGTVVNGAPWITTVGASTIDRDFESNVVLAGGKVIKGDGINFSTLKKSPVYPLIDGSSAKTEHGDEAAARNCNPYSMDEAKIKGKIVLCYNDDDNYEERNRLEEVKILGGLGMISVHDEERLVASSFGMFPATVISSDDAKQIEAYLNSTGNPVATILPTVAVRDNFPAPAIAYFSSRGPSILENILKPDVTAPGVDILAAWIGSDSAGTPGNSAPLFNVISGTSMSCPHVSGIAAAIKTRNPSFSPSAIRSAIMTTATQMNSLRSPIATHTGPAATPYEFGAGEVSPTRSLEPGLVYELNTTDYLNFLCYSGYSIFDIRNISRDVPESFSCPKESNTDLISDINYPSIVISWFSGRQSRSITRTLTNVAGDQETTYSADVNAPGGFNVKVVPDKLTFKRNGERQSFQVIFSTASSVEKDLFGSITWINGKYTVRSPLVVSSKSRKN